MPSTRWKRLENILDRTREAIFEVLGDFISLDPERAKEIIRKSTYLGSEDPGEWSPDAAVIIHCESGVPSGLYDRLFDKWFEVSRRLRTHYCEHINAAVIAVYEG